MDGSKAHGAKVFSLDQSELWIEALVTGEEGLSSADPVSFRAGAIDCIRGLGPKASVIRLKSGMEIFLGLPQQELLERLENAEGARLDLTSVSYSEGKGPLLNRLRAEFQKDAEAAKYAPLETMTFRAWVRPANKADFREFTFRGQDVRMRDITEGDSIMGGKNIRLKMNEGVPAAFDVPEFIIEGSLQEIRAMCMEAYERGSRELDLRAYSLRKGTTPPQDEQAQPPRKAPRP